MSPWEELSGAGAVRPCRAAGARGRTVDVKLHVKGRSGEQGGQSGGSSVVQARDSAGWFRGQRWQLRWRVGHRFGINAKEIGKKKKKIEIGKQQRLSHSRVQLLKFRDLGAQVSLRLCSMFLKLCSPHRVPTVHTAGPGLPHPALRGSVGNLAQGRLWPFPMTGFSASICLPNSGASF